MAQPRRVKHAGQRGKPLRRGQSQQHTIGIRRQVLCTPASGTGERDRDVAVGPRRIAQQKTQIVAVGQQPRALAAGQQHALRTARRAKPIGATAAMRRVQVVLHADRPGPQFGAAGRLHQPAAVFHSFAGENFVLPQRRAVAQTVRERHDDKIADALRSTRTAEKAKLATQCVPCLFESFVLPLGKQAQPRQHGFEFEAHERLGERRAEQVTIAKIESHTP